MTKKHSLIKTFIGRYLKEYDYYEQASLNARRLLEELMQQAGVRAIISHRAKDPDRLETKITQRFDANKHTTVDDLYDEIVDLAGIRIALYFPGERLAVKKIIEENFDIVGNAQEFPKKNASADIDKRFSGYGATHYRVRLGQESEGGGRYCEALIEIQVASVLMHAWSEVEHDLVYKPLDGDLSKGELQLLDQINGLMIAGEIALEQLQNARIVRLESQNKEFKNHYELADYLAGFAGDNISASGDIRSVGDVEGIYDIIVKNKLNTPKKMREYLHKFDDQDETQSVVSIIKEKFLNDDNISLLIEPKDNKSSEMRKYARGYRNSSVVNAISYKLKEINNNIRKFGEFKSLSIPDNLTPKIISSIIGSSKDVDLYYDSIIRADQIVYNRGIQAGGTVYAMSILRNLEHFSRVLDKCLIAADGSK